MERGMAESSCPVVSQEAMLFNESIAYNIRYARDQVSQEDVEAAAKAAQVRKARCSFSGCNLTCSDPRADFDIR